MMRLSIEWQLPGKLTRGLECLLLGGTRTDAGFHFGTQSSVTQEHLPSPTDGLLRPEWLF
jgi:hypothetical protein